MALGALQDGGVRPLQCLAQAAAYRRKVGTRGGAAEPNPGRRNQRGDPGTEELAPARAAPTNLSSSFDKTASSAGSRADCLGSGRGELPGDVPRT